MEVVIVPDRSAGGAVAGGAIAAQQEHSGTPEEQKA